MAEERIVFDFTKFEGENRPDINKYWKLNSKLRKEYSIESEFDNKVEIKIITEDGEEYFCIYYKKTTNQICIERDNNNKIDLLRSYVKDFNITKAEGFVQNEQIDIYANYSFFDGDTNFSGTKFNKDGTKFLGANFGNGTKDFGSCHFNSGKVYFTQTNFGNGNLNFKNCVFTNCEVDFMNSILGRGQTHFIESKFNNGIARFCEMNFGYGGAWFTKAEFNKADADFGGAKFLSGDVYFSRTIFDNRETSFNSTYFGEGSVYFDFTDFCDAEVKFSHIIIDSPKADFSYAHANNKLNFFKAQFPKSSIYFKGEKFENCEFSFLESTGGKVVFPEGVKKTHIELRFKSIDTLLFEDCTIEKTAKIDGLHEKSFLSFKDTINSGQIYFYNKPRIILKAIQKEIAERKKNNRKTSKQAILNNFAMIKENYHELGEYDGEDIAYRRYMKYKTNTWYGWPFLKPFKWMGGYGTQPWSIILFMIGFVALFAGIYRIFFQDQFLLTIDSLGKSIPAISNYLDALYYSGITFLTIGYGDMAPLCYTARFLSVAEGFIGLFLMSYLTVAVVRKLLR